MDPFNEVQDDAWATVGVLERLVREVNVRNSQDLSADIENNLQEFQEIYTDLEQALAVSEQQPQRFGLSSEDLRQRRNVLGQLKTRINQIRLDWHGKKQREVTTMSNRISQDENPFLDPPSGLSELQTQEVIQEQDMQLDSIHETMRNLNQQASMMGLELEDQGFMLDELDADLDHVGSKLQRGMRRVNQVIERNKETASNWCIGILTVVLCILLILVIAL